MKNKKAIEYFLIVLFSAISLYGLYLLANDNARVYNDVSANYGTAYTGEVLEIIDENYEEVVYDGFDTGVRIIYYEAVLTSGYREGQTVTAIQTLSEIYGDNIIPIQEGDEIVLLDNPDPAMPEIEFMFSEYHRIDDILLLAGVFCIFLILFGKMKGVSTLISLALTIISIFLVFVPSLLNGYNIYLWTIITTVYIIFMTLLVINGFSKKSLSAIIGCCFGVGTSGLLILLLTEPLHITGFVNQEALYLNTLLPEYPIDLTAVLFAMVTIGSIGAVMDVSMSLSSALYEIKEKSQNLNAAELIRSGFVIGRDIMGTMANTLILAYIGSSLIITSLLIAYNHPTTLLFNTELIVVELLQALVGSFGILLAIPLTSIVCAFLYQINPKDKSLNEILSYAKAENENEAIDDVLFYAKEEIKEEKDLDYYQKNNIKDVLDFAQNEELKNEAEDKLSYAKEDESE